MEIACEERSTRLAPDDLAFQVRAVNVQMEQHWAPAYDEEPWPVRSYANLQPLALGTFWPVAILDDIDGPGGAIGFHDFIAGLAYGRVLANGDPLDATTLSHEALELRGDPRVNLWLQMPDGRRIAREMCDPCEADSYEIPVTIGSEVRRIRVSDFVLPAYFVIGAPRPYTYLDTVDEPFGLSRNGGGYRLLRELDGAVVSDYGRDRNDSSVVYARLEKKIGDYLSRTARRGLRR